MIGMCQIYDLVLPSYINQPYEYSKNQICNQICHPQTLNNIHTCFQSWLRNSVVIGSIDIKLRQCCQTSKLTNFVSKWLSYLESYTRKRSPLHRKNSMYVQTYFILAKFKRSVLVNFHFLALFAPNVAVMSYSSVARDF